MNPQNRFQALVDMFKDDDEFRFQGLTLRLSEDIACLLETQNMTRGELARKLGCSPAFVTKLLKDPENITLKKLFKVAIALDSELRVAMGPPR